MKRRKKPVPPQFLRGQRFHKEVQRNWGKISSIVPGIEKYVIKFGGRNGRVDIWLEIDNIDDLENKLYVIFEIKSIDWDNVKRKYVRRYLKRHGMQLHDYLAGHHLDSQNVSMYAIYPKKPYDKELLELIERGMSSMGIVVFWWKEEEAAKLYPDEPTMGVDWK